MDIEEGIKRINGVIEVEIQGFFTERFINLCKINNIKIWDIKNIVSGIVRFNISIKDFKKLKSIARKTKCRVKILKKKGLYFNMFRYRKRKIAYLLILIFICLCIVSSTFVWNVEISGNESIDTMYILSQLKDAGLYIGKNKINLNTKNIINRLRINVSDIAWAGIEIDGTNAYVKIVEKTNLKEDNREDGTIGDIVSTKSGIIEKVTAENGTAISQAGDYIEEGRIVIEGKIYSKVLETKDVKAKGKIVLRTNYNYSDFYSYKKENKIYNGRKKYSIGLTINDKENYINYLDKSLSYDIIKSSHEFKLFGFSFSLDFYTFNFYDVEYVDRSEEEIIQQAKQDAQNYIDEVLPTLRNPQILNCEVSILDKTEEGINVNVLYTLNEEDGVYRKRN